MEWYGEDLDIRPVKHKYLPQYVESDDIERLIDFIRQKNTHKRTVERDVQCCAMQEATKWDHLVIRNWNDLKTELIQLFYPRESFPLQLSTHPQVKHYEEAGHFYRIILSTVFAYVSHFEPNILTRVVFLKNICINLETIMLISSR